MPSHIGVPLLGWFSRETQRKLTPTSPTNLTPTSPWLSRLREEGPGPLGEVPELPEVQLHGILRPRLSQSLTLNPRVLPGCKWREVDKTEGNRVREARRQWQEGSQGNGKLKGKEQETKKTPEGRRRINNDRLNSKPLVAPKKGPSCSGKVNDRNKHISLCWPTEPPVVR